MKHNLLMAFATHNPLTLVMYAYIAALGVRELGTDVLSGQSALIIVGLWLPVAAWEWSRKIRMPAEETEYVTYSKILGPRRAAMVPTLFVSVSAAALLVAAQRCELPLWYQITLASAAAVVLARCIQFIAAPTSSRAKLRPFVEVYAVVTTLALVVALLASNDVRWLS